MNILMTGGTGFLGSALAPLLLANGDNVGAWVRNVDRARKVLPSAVTLFEHLPSHKEQQWDAVINLAGAPILGARWTDGRKQELRDSRIGQTQTLVRWMSQAESPIPVMLSGSACGYYGNCSPRQTLTESSSAQECFPHQLCRDWEEAALHAQNQGTRVCLLRTGVVLDKQKGALKQMLPPFRLGLGGPIGDGNQVMSWIHLQDWLDAVVFLLKNPTLQGAFNLTAPHPVSNRSFAKSLGQVLHRPAILPMPASVMHLLLGEAAELVTQGQKVIPERLEEAGFIFAYPQLDEALSAIFEKKPETKA
ncbi:TIGR01777 family oxidoreductase [Pokkaliibacter sp. CJK22405]|uniref:TIGR01777 family oxidoreductase n=1 Tax=Pokkaliibacter sp. CJK22405 TaxID=3384615 RepID=UPI003985599F